MQEDIIIIFMLNGVLKLKRLGQLTELKLFYLHRPSIHNKCIYIHDSYSSYVYGTSIMNHVFPLIFCVSVPNYLCMLWEHA